MAPPLRTKLGALAAHFHFSNIYVASGQFCGCSSLVIPVHVDVLIPKDPADPFGGLKAMQPNTAVSPEKADVIQFLVHGFTYTSQYWSPQTEEFRNYSYTEFACARGLSSLAIDLVVVGLSSRPANASDVQYTTNAAVVSQLARHLKIASIIAGVQPFKKVIAIGHSYERARRYPASVGRPRPNYITTNNRSLFYPTNPNSFSPRMVIFDAFTKDVGPLSTQLQSSVTSLPAHYPGPVAKVVGGPRVCAAGNCVDVVALNAAERLLWPDARSFDVVVAQGSGHDLNLDFFAKGPFNTFADFVEQSSAL
ncbi:hypothetical protein C8J57DRAFT_1547587 [Mycena rebaudengoi]|nr:hypothetical protein C8J57DRAFT_1547587 [Mycena rebaudengoi]